MNDPSPSPLERIERAIARIETSATVERGAHDALAKRHETLRARIRDAVAALDTLINTGGIETGGIETVGIEAGADTVEPRA